jgi:hypothetical protein
LQLRCQRFQALDPQRVHHLKVIDGNDPVNKAEIVKGYEYSI